MSLGTSKQSLSPRRAGRASAQCRDDGWAGRGNKELCRAGTVGVNGKVQDIAGVDVGEAEPKEAEDISGGRAELWMFGDVGAVCEGGSSRCSLQDAACWF